MPWSGRCSSQVLARATDDCCLGPSRARHAAVRAPYRVIAAVLLAVSGLAACSSGQTAAKHASVVRVTERDFRIAASPARVPSGAVLLTVENRGPVSHELIVVRTDRPTLP